MNTSTIRRALNNHSLTKYIFKDVVPYDLLPIRDISGVYVVNTDPHDQPGQHWVVVHHTPSAVLYVDPYGIPPPDPVASKLRSTKKNVFFVTRRVQGCARTCGLYCIYYILCLVSPLHTMDIFSDDFHANDRIVRMHVPRLFDVHQ